MMHRCNDTQNYFSAISSLLHSYFIFNQIKFNEKMQIYYFLNIRNFLNYNNYLQSKQTQKLYQFGSDQNLLFFDKESDDNMMVKMVVFDDKLDETHKHNGVYMDLLLFLLYSVMTNKLQIDNLHSFWIKTFKKIKTINSNLQHFKS